MQITEMLIFYSLVGVVVATSFRLARPAESVMVATLQFGLHLVLWPFFAPLLLGRVVDDTDNRSDEAGLVETQNLEDPRIGKVERQLMEALDAVGGIADELLGDELDSIRDLCDSLAKMDERIAGMDNVLDSDEFDRKQVEAALHRLLDNPDVDDGDERIESVRARRRNIERLHTMRRQARRDLDRALLKMEEIASQILLLQFADQPEDEIADNIHDIASTIDGLETIGLGGSVSSTP